MGNFDIFAIMRQILIFMVPFIFSLSIHEAAHAWVANRFGDPTARLMGRMTLNPLPHLDVFGTILFPIIAIASGSGIFFGWAKPVPVNHLHLKDVKKGFFWISLAGPASNFILAIIAALLRLIVYKILINTGSSSPILEPIFIILHAMVSINVALAIFNLIPVPPLDGSKILAGLLPDRYAEYVYRLEQYGFIILLALIFTGAIRVIAYPIILIIHLLNFGMM